VVGIPVLMVGVSFIVAFDCFVEIMSNFSRFVTSRIGFGFFDTAPPTMFVSDVTVAS
jgi:hypothetical protein